MDFYDKIFTAVAQLLLDEGNDQSNQLLNSFDDFVVALCIDSGLPREEVQSRLVEKMLQDSRHISLGENVNWLDNILRSESL